MARRIGKVLLKLYPFDENRTCVLDFACGPGLNSRILAPYAKTIVGMDISQAMVDRYNERASNQGIPEEEMRAICIPEELFSNLNEVEATKNVEQIRELLDGAVFDVVVCCMSYHHFRSISYVTRILSSFLKPGGRLFVADVESVPRSTASPDVSHHMDTFEPIFEDGACDAGIIVHKYGFSAQEMKNVFAEAGLVHTDSETGKTSFEYSIVTRALKQGKKVNIFLASGAKDKNSDNITDRS
ncbi:hypothetical protein GYMLUDRAFT_212600 [Collybiopsis luxurians FD-317 M1]|nr:hypothetical protein GYMLUDRAFT_212600 [Collybiopsis luxurians FD-317 M1]